MKKKKKKRKKNKKNNRLKKLNVVLLMLLIFLIIFLSWEGKGEDDIYLKYKNGKLPYNDLIEEYSKEYNLEKAFVASVIQVESSFRDSVESNKSRIGLMQIIPETGDWISLKLGIGDFSSEDLYDPEINIRYGTYFLRYLLDKYEYKHIALGAYNAGMGNVDKWLEKGILNGDINSSNNIPFKETREYIFKVKDNYEKFKGLEE